MAPVNISIAIREKGEVVECSPSSQAEDLCTVVCRKLQISPISTTLFALRLPNSNIYLPPNAPIEPYNNLVLRIRYRVPNLTVLKTLDPQAHNYYFHQVKNDVWDNRVPEIVYAKHRDELLGLGVTDMYRLMVEENKNVEELEKDYRKYIPREVIKKHKLFTKKPIHNTLIQFSRSSYVDAGFIKEQYLKQFNTMAPNYLSEECEAFYDSVVPVIVHVTPFHKEEPGLRMYYKNKKEWEHLCTIDELCFMSSRADGTIEISRRNGIPVYLKFSELQQMLSFVSVCDGYYRLMVKWTFNLCKEVTSPALQLLHNMKCHGPVGGEFSYHKLEEKRANKSGCFILRQCEKYFDTYYLDVCSKNSTKPETYRIERKGNAYMLHDKEKSLFLSLVELVSCHKDPENSIYLQECLPPSEYDKSQVLLCEDTILVGGSRIDVNSLENVLANIKGPRCIHARDIKVFKNTRIASSENLSLLFKAFWEVAPAKKFEVAMKMLKQDASSENMKEFIDRAGQWAFLQSSALVRLYGVILRSPVAMVMEYLPMGSLDAYLRENKLSIQIVELVESASSLATALWHLAENGIVHGNIRCRKLLVASHDNSHLYIKLSDPGLHTTYGEDEFHWLPIEFFNNMNSARMSPLSDVWAFATTLWEIFSFGVSPTQINPTFTKKSYLGGNRLLLPAGCPQEVFSVMKACWHPDQHSRMRAHMIMRDINNLHYQVYNSRRNVYDTLSPKTNKVTGSAQSLTSNVTGESVIDNLTTASELEQSSSCFSEMDTTMTFDGSDDDTPPYDINNFSSHEMQDVFEWEDFNVILQGCIGQGFYGEVFKGTLESKDGSESKHVAVKRLKQTVQPSLEDFDREIEIMKSLKHPNIVDIIAVLEEPQVLIMEYIQHGSLQSYLKIYKHTIMVHQLLKYAQDVAMGMEYLGNMNIVHRDLAARNILVVNENHVKISDFGLAQFMQGDYYILKTIRELPLKWYAPESVNHGKFSTKSDVWSYGVTLYEMFSFGEEPPAWGTDSTSPDRSSRLDRPSFCPVEVYLNMLLPCWKLDPTERSSFTQLLAKCTELQHGMLT